MPKEKTYSTNTYGQQFLTFFVRKDISTGASTPQKYVLIKRRGFLSPISCPTFGTVRRFLRSPNYQEFLTKFFFIFLDGESSLSKEHLYKNQ